MKIGVLALQGAFAEHIHRLEQLGASCVELRQPSDLDSGYDGLVLPGGESTVQGKLLRDLGMFHPLLKQISDGMPVLATCAGAILLSDSIEGSDQRYFGTIPMQIRRNAYGRQSGSFHTTAPVSSIGTVPMTFIRAPFITQTGADVEPIAVVDDHIVGVRYHNQLAFSFHPELDPDCQIHQTFLDLVQTTQK